MSLYTTISCYQRTQAVNTPSDYQNLAVEALFGVSSLELNKK